MKKLLSILLALVIIIVAVPMGAFEFKAEAAVSCPTMDSENAMAFIGFITNNGKLTEQQIKSSDAYKIITGTYTGEDFDVKAEALKTFIWMKTDMMANNAEANRDYYVENIVKYLEKQVPHSGNIGVGEVVEDAVNTQKNHCLRVLNEAFKDIIDAFCYDASSFFQVSDLVELYNGIQGSIGKAQKIVDYMLLAMNSICTVFESEYAGRYGYFQSYLSNREGFEPDEPAFLMWMEYDRSRFAYQNFWAGFIDMFSFITNKDSFLKHFDTLDRWAEYTYLLKEYVDSIYADIKIENTSVSVTNAYFAANEFTMFYNYVLTNPVNIYPYNATNKTVTYSSGNTSIATVDSSGKITPKSPGTVTIYGKVGDVTTNCVITILPFYADRVNNQYTITNYCGKGGRVTIPSNVSDGRIVTISKSAFRNCSTLTSVTIPDSVTSIGNWAFDSCTRLTSVTIPNSVTSIGYYAFYNCDSLTSITIPDGVTSIDMHAFSDCDHLTSVNIGDSVKRIDETAFRNCDSLTAINVGEGNEYYCDIDGVLFDKDVTTLIQYPIGRTDTTYSIPNSVTNIGDDAFQYCDSLERVTIPDSVTSIGYNPFLYCDSLATINVGEGNEYYCDIDGVFFDKDVTTLIQYPVGKTDTTYTIPNSVTSIDGAFRNCSNLTSVIIGDNVTSIGDAAFLRCTRLTSVTIPNSVTSICDDAFYFCSSLTSITIPNGVTSIGQNAFYYCSSLTSIIIPDSVTSIGDYAFDSCLSLTSATIGNGVTSISNSAFNSCDNLKSITIPDGVTRIGNWAFEGCTSLASITISDSVRSIGYYAFYNCDSLTNVKYNGSKKQWDTISIGNYNDFIINANVIYLLGDAIFTTDTSGNVGVKADEGAFPSNTEIVFDSIVETHEQFAIIQESLKEISSKFVAYNITPSNPLNDGTEAEISFIIPNNFSNDVAVYYVDTEKGVYERLETTIRDGKAYATTNHFSVYVLVDESIGEIETDQNLKFAGASLTLTDNISVNYKVAKDAVADYSNLYVKFTFGGRTYTVKRYTTNGDNYVFTFNNIAPNQINQVIYATLYGTKDDIEYESAQSEYSVAQYCYNMLEKCADDKYAEFRTLLVDLLNYGAQSQIYTEYNTDNLANATLTDTQKVWGTSGTPTLQTVQNLDYETIENPSVLWRGGGLVLDDSVTMRFIIQADNIENLSVKIKTNSKTYNVKASSFKSIGNNLYYVYFNGLNASQMSETVYLTVYNGDSAVSNTLRYSIESYAYAKVGGEDIKLSNLLIAMMKYGYAAYNYVN